eukprot:scaffold8445_cov145-Skeletonema_marinoi.AAC.3
MMTSSSSFIIPKLPKYFSSVGGRSQLLASFSSLSPPSSTHKRKLSSQNNNNNLASSQSWSEEWESLGLGARLPKPGSRLTNLMFVQMGFGVDQHGNDGSSGSGGSATQASVRAVRNAIEFNSIPVPGGRSEMLISVKLGIPLKRENSSEPMEVNLNEVAKVFPYGRLMPIQTVVGGLTFNTGRIVRELGDVDDLAVCVAACVSIGYDSGKREGKEIHAMHDTKDGN